jgi:hypothetical protein
MSRFLAAVALFLAWPALACEWGSPARIGTLDAGALPEVSGFALSAAYPERLYAVNDSEGPAFAVLARDGRGPVTLRLAGVPDRQIDLEGLGLGPCGVLPGSCLFIANSGGNNFRREQFPVYLVAEADIGPALAVGAVAPRHTLTLRYPDGPHDAEGFAVAPGGDLYVLTKPTPSLAGTPPAKLYRARGWQDAPEEVQVLEHVADLHLQELSLSRLDVFSHVATALDIHPDGDRLLVLTYGDAFELLLDPSALHSGARLGADTPHRRVALERLPQQESAAYTPDGLGFVYSSEARALAEVPLLEVRCAVP